MISAFVENQGGGRHFELALALNLCLFGGASRHGTPNRAAQSLLVHPRTSQTREILIDTRAVHWDTSRVLVAMSEVFWNGMMMSLISSSMFHK